MNYVRPDKHVYFLRREDGTGPIKVGCSRAPLGRLAELSRWSPYKLAILATARAGHEWERRLHYIFSGYRLHSEWFDPSPRLLAVIDGVAAGLSLEDAVAALDHPEPMREAA